MPALAVRSLRRGRVDDLIAAVVYEGLKVARLGGAILMKARAR